MAQDSPSPRDEIAASLQTSRELGPDYDDAVAASLAQRLDQTIAEQVRAQIDTRITSGQLPNRTGRGVGSNTLRLVMGIISLGVAIPLSGIGGAMAGAPGLVAVWIGILMVYFVVTYNARD